ncbi:serine/threonine-protein kinase [Propionivibrio sp.]|uniref:serine/threonine-protein kinase n=1 Tax=Propionivibrio sp. TaxID=2212460 RepID=UPI0025E28CE8|nr:serine/threonine-protein kinase [Propionivibrio sp.]MBK7355674.1 protein kinase [Propionivibrio sp.]MBK8400662.1 protein kinase [Propionivibrio sp.]MBK8745467.1 protein kinase [Propionivibrio sp.]MBK8893669.1 protein kinase [Propionivibrio sp.]MBL0207021.1 protein kinase [Propionivibrio sp.]
MDKIGKYDIVRELGRGATATVFLGYDPFTQRDVAVKVAFPEILKNPERGKLYTHLFLNEASLVGKLLHPHIVQIFDAVVDESLCYIVMEYVPGGTLEDFTSPNKLLPIERVVEIIFKCTRALDFANRIGITHRDIKPANILFPGNTPTSGDIKISDFGAAIIDDLERTQVSGIGSPAYMSPQQVKEQPLDHQTDIYSLGVVMYQLLTGQLPFQASTNYNIIYQIINTEPTKPSALRKKIPDALDAIVTRAMAKSTRQRYQTWEEFSHDLAQAFRNKQVKVPKRIFSDSEKYDTLRELPFFADFSDAELWEVLGFSQWRSIAPDEAILQEGDPGDFFCFLAEGELKVTKNGRILNLLTTGDCFGEMAVISKSRQTRGADVVALTQSKILTVKGKALQQASEACRMHFYQSFLDVLTNRLELSNARLAAY